jgi:6-phospho-3-hexuloisomerase
MMNRRVIQAIREIDMSEGSEGPTRLWTAVEDEIRGVLQRVDPSEVERLRAVLNPGVPGRRFFTGQGRSGLIARMAAMRVMHLGGCSHVVGDVTTPAFEPDDVLCVISASGRTPGALLHAQRAHEMGGQVCCLTASDSSALAQLSDPCLVVPAGKSAQFGSVLFTQAALVVLDGIFLSLSADKGQLMADLHANLE